jgi:hypothetical protein
LLSHRVAFFAECFGLLLAFSTQWCTLATEYFMWVEDQFGDYWDAVSPVAHCLAEEYLKLVNVGVTRFFIYHYIHNWFPPFIRGTVFNCTVDEFDMGQYDLLLAFVDGFAFDREWVVNMVINQGFFVMSKIDTRGGSDCSFSPCFDSANELFVGDCSINGVECGRLFAML